MRRRYHYLPGHPKANERGFVAQEDLDAASSADVATLPVFTDRYMEGLRASDGTDIGSRSKRRDYMTANNLADMGDYTNHLAAAQKKREEFYTTGGDHKERREQLGRALYELRSGKRKR